MTMQVKARNHGRSLIGMSYFGIRKRWDFMIVLDTLWMSFRPSVADEVDNDIGMEEDEK